MSASCSVLTIGHSDHTWERFGWMLRNAGVTAIADVRSAPYSRRAPHFSRGALTVRLKELGIAYVFLGRELGGRPSDRAEFTNGTADYEKMAQSSRFQEGLDRVVEGAARYRIALMCAERDPLDCHRCLLVGRRLRERGLEVAHLLADGCVLTQEQVEDLLLGQGQSDQDDLYASRADRLAAAYRSRGRRIAYAEAQSEPESVA